MNQRLLGGRVRFDGHKWDRFRTDVLGRHVEGVAGLPRSRSASAMHLVRHGKHPQIGYIHKSFVSTRIQELMLRNHV